MREPLISIIIPVYKAEKYLKRCIDSVSGQTYRNLEIILVDDGSPDKCGEMCEEIALIDKRVRIIHKENGGQASARNMGLDIANGDYIGFVDADDYIETRMYKTLYNLMVHNRVQIACCGTNLVDENQTIKATFSDPAEGIILYSQKDALKEHLYNKRITSSLCDKLYRAEMFHGVRMIERMIYEDLEVIPHCIAKAKSIAYTSEVLYYYVMTLNSTIRGNFGIRQFDEMKAGKLRVEFYQSECPDFLNLAKETYAEICLNLIYQSYRVVECKKLRDEAVHEVRRILLDIGWNRLCRKILIKTVLLKISTPVYSVLMIYYSKVSKSIRESRRQNRK